MRVRYDGTGFHGSQVQRGQRTVSGTLTTELNSLLGQKLHLLWAGRTDSGVHADGNVCSFDARLAMPVDRLAGMLNDRLGDDLRVIQAWTADAEFHPRFDAQWRSYTYRIWRGMFSPVDRARFVHEYARSLDLDRFRSCSGLFAGEHCFRAFCKQPEEGDACICRIEPFEIIEHGPELEIRIRGNRFLRHMICRMLGAMLAVCEGRLTEVDIKAALETGRELKLEPAPGKGLTLTWVEYEVQPRDRN